MRLEIYDEKEKCTKEPVILCLKYNSGGRLSLVVVNKDGNIVDSGFLLSIQSDGTFSRIRNVDPELGFELDEYGKIKVD